MSDELIRTLNSIISEMELLKTYISELEHRVGGLEKIIMNNYSFTGRDSF